MDRIVNWIVIGGSPIAVIVGFMMLAVANGAPQPVGEITLAVVFGLPFVGWATYCALQPVETAAIAARYVKEVGVVTKAPKYIVCCVYLGIVLYVAWSRSIN